MGWKNIVKFDGGSSFSSKGLFFRKTIIATSDRIVKAIQFPILFNTEEELCSFDHISQNVSLYSLYEMNQCDNAKSMQS